MIKQIAAIAVGTLLVGAMASAQTSSASSGTTSASATEIKKEIAPKFTASFANWSQANMKDTNERQGLAESLNWLALGYKVTDKTTVGLRQYFSYNYATPNASNDDVRATLRDRDANTPDDALGKAYKTKNPVMETLTAYVNTSADSIAGSREIPIVVRFDMPTSERYADQALNGRIYAVTDTRWDVAGPVNAGVQITPWAYLKYSDSTALESTPNYRLTTQAVVAANFPDLEIGQLAGFDTKYRSNGAKNTETAELETYIDWAIIKNLDVYFSVANSYPVLDVASNRKRTDGIYLQEETNYNLITTLSF